MGYLKKAGFLNEHHYSTRLCRPPRSRQTYLLPWGILGAATEHYSTALARTVLHIPGSGKCEYCEPMHAHRVITFALGSVADSENVRMKLLVLSMSASRFADQTSDISRPMRITTKRTGGNRWSQLTLPECRNIESMPRFDKTRKQAFEFSVKVLRQYMAPELPWDDLLKTKAVIGFTDDCPIP
jgi:hypothetical protein